MPLLEALAILRHGTWGLRPALHARLLSSTGLHAILLLRRARLVHATVHVGVSRVCHGVHLSVAHVALAWHLRWQHLACLLLLGLLRLLLLLAVLRHGVGLRQRRRLRQRRLPHLVGRVATV